LTAGERDPVGRQIVAAVSAANLGMTAYATGTAASASAAPPPIRQCRVPALVVSGRPGVEAALSAVPVDTRYWCRPQAVRASPTGEVPISNGTIQVFEFDSNNGFQDDDPTTSPTIG
jgi:hypothetical protein